MNHDKKKFILTGRIQNFPGVTTSVANWDADVTECSIILEDNTLVDFVELLETCQGLYYCNVLCGFIRGALEMVRVQLRI